MQDKKGYIGIPFSESWQGAASGQHVGCYNFNMQKNNILLQPANSRTNQVMTVTVTNAAVLTSGTYRFRVGNEYTSPLAYNASATNVKDALEALKISQAHNITYTLSGALSSSATPTLTITSGNYTFQDGEISVHSGAFTGSSVPTSITIATTTPYVAGVSGTVDISLYAFVYKTVYQNRNRITSSLDVY